MRRRGRTANALSPPGSAPARLAPAAAFRVQTASPRHEIRRVFPAVAGGRRSPLARQTSHLFGVYPGRQITPATPKFFAAARRVLEIRGDDGTGWSLGWKINFWARFRDGDHAYVLIKNLLRPVGDTTATNESRTFTAPF
jgi:hypothetical protein